MKKVICIIIMALMFGIITASAQNSETLHIGKGWNLISASLFDEIYKIISDRDNTEALFLYNPETKEYLIHTNEHPLYEEDLAELVVSYADGDVVGIVWSGVGSMWYYSTESFDLSISQSPNYNLLKNPLEWIDDNKRNFGHWVEKFSRTEIRKGWNLIGVNGLMVENSILDFKGDCTVSKIYFFDSDEQKWGGGKLEGSWDDPLPPWFLGRGMAIKVDDNCQFDFTESSDIPELPSLPD